MPLDPRNHRLDDLLRRPLQADDPIEHGPHIKTISGSQWGFPEAIQIGDSRHDCPLHLEIRADGQLVPPAEGIWRPSHCTRMARCNETGLQIVEDRFGTHDNAVVCALWIRNPTDLDVALSIQRVARGTVDSRTGHSIRSGPPQDDLVGHLGGRARKLFVFAIAWAQVEEHAWSTAHRWSTTDNPVQHHVDNWEKQLGNQIPRFESDNPWLDRIWAHRLHRRRQESQPPATPDHVEQVQSDFVLGDYDRPSPDALAWERWIVDSLAGLSANEEAIEISPCPDAAGLRCWCVENIHLEGHRIDAAWDDPTVAEDAFHDGRRGFDVWIDGRHRFHSETPTRARLRWQPETTS